MQSRSPEYFRLNKLHYFLFDTRGNWLFTFRVRFPEVESSSERAPIVHGALFGTKISLDGAGLRKKQQ